jgi:hypothetical protein
MEGRKEDTVYTAAWGEVRDTEVGVTAQTIDYPVHIFGVASRTSKQDMEIVP